MTTNQPRTGRPRLLRALEIARTKRKAVRAFRRTFGHDPDLVDPRSFKDRMVHRLVYDRDPRLTMLNDKVAVKDYVTQRLGPGYSVPLLGKWRSPREIDWAALPDRFVLKPNGDSGKNVVVRTATDRNASHLSAIAGSWLAGRQALRWRSEG